MSASTLSLLRWTLREIARMERDGYKPQRLIEPHHELWHRVRRKLGWVAFIELLHEDLAAAFPTSFALERWSVPPTLGLEESAAKALIDEACQPDDADSLGFLRAVCRGLGLMEGGNVAMLPRVQPHQRALVLPGCGGRIAAYQVTTSAGLSFHEHFIFVADTDEERIAIGLAAAEQRANAPTIVTSAGLEAARPATDHVFGIRGYASAERLAATLALAVRWA